MVYSFFWDDQRRLFLVHLRPGDAPGALKIKGRDPDGAETLLAIAPVIDREGGSCPTACVRIPDGVEHLSVHPVLTGGPQLERAAEFFDDITLGNGGGRVADAMRSFWIMTSKRPDSMMRVRSADAQTGAQPEIADDELGYVSHKSGRLLAPGRVVGDDASVPRYRVRITPDAARTAPVKSRLFARTPSVSAGHKRSGPDTYLLEIDIAPESAGAAEQVHFVCQHLSAASHVLRAIGSTEGLGREYPGIALSVPPGPDPDYTGLPFDDHDDVTQDTPLGFLDRLVLTADQRVDLIFDDGSQDPPLARDGVMVLAYYGDNRFVPDTGALHAAVDADPSLVRKGAPRDTWRPHPRISGQLAEALDGDLAWPSAAAFTALRSGLNIHAQAAPERAHALSPYSFDAYAKVPEFYQILLDAQCFEVAESAPPGDGAEDWLHDLCLRQMTRRLAAQPHAPDRERVKAWAEMFRASPWRFYEFLQLPCAPDAVRHGLKVGSGLVSSFAEAFATHSRDLESIAATEADLALWGCLDDQAGQLRDFDEIASHLRAVATRRDAMFRSMARAERACGIYVDAPAEWYEDARPASRPVSLSMLGEEAEVHCRTVMQDDADMPEALRLHLAQWFAAEMDHDCERLSDIARGLRMRPVLNGPVLTWTPEGGATAVPGLGETHTQFSGKTRDPSYDRARDDLDYLQPSSFLFVNRAADQLRAAIAT